ncbi:MAG: glucosidase, partial [Pyrinomonadaceae bacterium]|nr:glucosidase [Pyrinomonadaceae bacterium]
LRAFRWNEDGLAGFCDRNQAMCFSVGLWNGRDPIIKERLFGLTGNQGNHGEDVKEYYFYLDATPTHSYCKFLYKYPQATFPYQQLFDENRRRDKNQPEFELLETGIFDEDKYFDVFVEYAKDAPEDVFIKLTIVNRANQSAPLNVLPQIWFRDVWSWKKDAPKPNLEKINHEKGFEVIKLDDIETGEYFLYCHGEPQTIFCENETNLQKLYNVPNASKYAKDGINDFVVNNNLDAVNPEQKGTKAAANYNLSFDANETKTVYLRFTKNELSLDETDNFIEKSERVLSNRKAEADAFYADIIPHNLSHDAKNVMRQSLAGMLWSKQFYHYEVKNWLDGDEPFPPPPASRKKARNRDWKHLYNADVVSMPDKWEYPWYAAWDLAFHCVPLALVDSGFAKRQLILLLREWYMHPNGQLPAYEWAFGDVNPPVHAWAALRVFQIERKRRGKGDYEFLEKVFHKLLLNFTWWVNRKDEEGNNVFGGGFLGLDNIGVFDRNTVLPDGGHLEQSDGTSWMGMFSLNMMEIALELAKKDKAYEDVASKFFEHFIYIADAMNNIGGDDIELWNERDGFYYDVMHFKDNAQTQLKVRSMVGLIPLFGVATLDAVDFDELPDFKRRIEWFLKHRSELTDSIECLQTAGKNGRRILAIVNRDRLKRVLRLMLDETEFLSDYGIRSVSRFHKNNPYTLKMNGSESRVDYEPAESRSGMFGGNSNWRGPIWFPVNYLLIESLQKFDYYFGEDFKIEFPTGSERMLTLWEVSQELSKRMNNIFLQDEEGRRPVFGKEEKFQSDENWRDYVLFYEYFHGDNGAGLGASHQTGWTGLIAKMLQQIGDYSAKNQNERDED